jgi:lipopolysaccharide/colanic/teichoic acid biosynthesis glycosyltransferase
MEGGTFVRSPRRRDERGGIGQKAAYCKARASSAPRVALFGRSASNVSTGTIKSGDTPASPSVVAGRQARGVNLACRTLDVVVAVLMLILVMPLLMSIAAAIRLDSPGPVLFRQRRLGRGLEPFTVHKFRTMYPASRSSRA